MHSTSCQELSQEKTDFNHVEETAKPQDPRNSHIPKNPLICRNQMHTPTSAPGVEIHCRQRDFNVLQESFNVRYVTNLDISLVCYQKSPQSSNSFQTRKPKAQQLQAGALYTHHDADQSGSKSDTEDSFCLQMKIHKTQISHPEVPKPIYLMANLAYHLQEHHRRNQYLWARLDTCADVNLMPMAVYCLMFKDPGLRKLTPSNMEIETHTNDVVKIVGTCYFYLVHSESKQLMKVLFFVTKENGSVLLSCRTTMELGLIRPHVRIDYLPPKASLLTSTCDQPSKTRTHRPNIHYTKEKPTKMAIPKNGNIRTPQSQKAMISEDAQLITRKEQIMTRFPNVFEGIGKFPGEPYKIQLDLKVPPKQTPCRPVPIHLKEVFKAEIDKMLKAGVLKPIQEATPWINSFVLVEGTDQQGKPKLRICLDPTNLNKAII